ncbi:pyrimidodiazepine synthase [Neodiprion pinetum]|uniref:pyrimidodiazepine synthase n=1 Tax=Neodiprion pinetum TaxID=441929 RepID=UPI00076FCC68
MSALHLSAGSNRPAPVDGKARLYSMKFCPYSHRARLILTLKNVPHDIVNINLKSKPEWYFEINPNGKVPTFVDVDGKVVDDSLAIANYLNERYPEPPLYREETKARDIELIDKYGVITSLFGACIHKRDTRPLQEIVGEIIGHFVAYEEELGKRGTIFFGGTEPGMLDVLMWPWVERAKALPLAFDQPLNFDKEKFPHLMKWINGMKGQKFVQKNFGPFEAFAKVIKAQDDVDYDSI